MNVEDLIQELKKMPEKYQVQILDLRNNILSDEIIQIRANPSDKTVEIKTDSED